MNDILKLKEKSKDWYIIPCSSLITQTREMETLQKISLIKFKNAILRPDIYLNKKLSDLPRIQASEIGKGIDEMIRREYDESQADAIAICSAHFRDDEKEAHPIIMIQGPPGTGKTKTVKGILNLWHVVQFNKYYHKVI